MSSIDDEIIYRAYINYSLIHSEHVSIKLNNYYILSRTDAYKKKL